MALEEHENLDTTRIRDWQSIVTLVVFVLTNINVLFAFHIPIYLPRQFADAILSALRSLRIIPNVQDVSPLEGPRKPYVRLRFPMNMVTAPLIADLFLLAIKAIGRQEVHDGTIGTESIQPIDVMVFFITLAYIAISIDASGLIRYLAFKVLQWGGKVGARLFFFLYAFFFLLGSFIGNDPIILSGTAFLAYMTRVSSNIVHPRAWIYTQFAIANIASAILVSSNPTNLVLAGAFGIKFIHYTANMIVPVVATAIVLFPFLLYIVFADEDLIPISIKMHDLPEEMRAKKPVNPNIPHARGYVAEEENDLANDEQGKLLSLEEIMNPFLDKKGATFGALIMGATLITVLVLNAASTATGEHPVFYVTLPAAFITFCWDVTFGWLNREETRQIARNGRQQIETTRAERALRKEESRHASVAATNAVLQEPFEPTADSTNPDSQQHGTDPSSPARLINNEEAAAVDPSPMPATDIAEKDTNAVGEKPSTSAVDAAENEKFQAASEDAITRAHTASMTPSNEDMNTSAPESPNLKAGQSGKSPKTLVSVSQDVYKWAQETFPTAMAVLTHLPFALVPFAFAMFVLVQALVTKGWVPVFAYGWDHWVKKTGTVGAIGGMGFLSVVLCNFAGTNIGTTILLSRVIQAWQAINREAGVDISDRTFWATVYGMALGVNYGAFSTAFSASLAGLLWRDILLRKHIRVRSLDFARINLPIIAIAMAVGCTVLVGQIYITRSEKPYDS